MKKNHTFERFETKYLLTKSQRAVLMNLINQTIVPDTFAHTHIVSVYFDTLDYRIIRESIEATDFKEKLRLRKYISQSEQDALFFEIKRKVEGVVYKRRKGIDSLDDVLRIQHENSVHLDQIEHEIHYAFERHPDLNPSILIGYDRDSFKAIEDDAFRLTLDTSIKARFDDVMNFEDLSGTALVDPEVSLMEVKTRWGYPRWFLDFLNETGVTKQSFSKYGNAFKQKINEGVLIYG